MGPEPGADGRDADTHSTQMDFYSGGVMLNETATQPMRELLQDAHFALRMARRSPGATAVIVLSLALGIGANTAIFSVAEAMLLRPLEFPEPDRLVDIWLKTPNLGIPRDWLSPGEYMDLKTQTDVFADTAIALGDSFNVTGIPVPERVEGMRASSSLFRILGARTAAGRAYGVEADKPGGPNVAILTNGVWRRVFGADPKIIGRPITINGRQFTVVAILQPESMRIADVMPAVGGVENPEIFIPVPMGPEAANNRDEENYNVVARLAPGVSLERAQAAVATVAGRIREKDRRDRTFDIYLVPLMEQAVGGARRTVLVLLAAVGLVLLIACANVANLLLARASAREKEAAIRSALGSGRARLVRQMLTESMATGLAGGICGMALAWLLISAIRVMQPGNIPRVENVGIDATVLFFAFGVSLATGVLFGMAPAMRVSRVDLASSLKGGGRVAQSGHGGDRLRGALVVAEIGLATMLLVGAGLLVRSFLELGRVQPGFDPEGVSSLRISLRGQNFRQGAQVFGFFQRLRESASRSPQIKGLAAVSALPMGGPGGWGGVDVEGYLPPPGQPELQVDLRSATPGYFDVMRIPMLAGRGFSDRDLKDSTGVAIVDEKMAKRFWPNQKAVGKRLRLSGRSPWLDVVGVVRTVKQEGLDLDTRPAVYFPHTQLTMQTMFVVARTLNPAEIARQIRALDPELPVYSVATMGDVVSKSLAARRFSMLVLATLAGFAALLAAIGIFGVMSYQVTQETNSIGVRMALGAPPSAILSMVLRRGLLLAAIGLALGLSGAAFATKVMESLLFGVQPLDVETFILVTALVAATAVAASLGPAARAAHVDPARALQGD